MPTPLTPPLPVRPPRRRRWKVPWLTLTVLLLFALAVAGAVIWAAALSPYGLVRLSAVGGDRGVTISRPGTYLVFEEDPGAARPDLPPPLVISVLDSNGRAVEVRMLVDPGDTAAPSSYNVPPHEGRAIARFDASREGRYLVQVGRLEPGTYDPSDYSDDQPDGLAVGRQLAVPWLRTPLGLLLLAGVPLVAGVALAVVARRRRRAAHSRPERSGASGSLPTHG